MFEKVCQVSFPVNGPYFTSVIVKSQNISHTKTVLHWNSPFPSDPSVTNNKGEAVVPPRCGGNDIYWLFVS